MLCLNSKCYLIHEMPHDQPAASVSPKVHTATLQGHIGTITSKASSLVGLGDWAQEVLAEY